MKIYSKLFLLFVVVLYACSGSDSYQGNWKAMDVSGNKFEITFKPKEFAVKDSLGKSMKFEYSQHSVEISNGIKTYGIKLQDGRTYSIKFPLANNDHTAVMLLDNNEVLYTLSRNAYVRYEDLYKLSE